MRQQGGRSPSQGAPPPVATHAPECDNRCRDSPPDVAFRDRARSAVCAAASACSTLVAFQRNTACSSTVVGGCDNGVRMLGAVVTVGAGATRTRGAGAFAGAGNSAP